MQTFLDYIATLVASPLSPITVIYLNMAMVHLMAMQCYRVHKDGEALAICAGLTSAQYLHLALIHAAGH